LGGNCRTVQRADSVVSLLIPIPEAPNTPANITILTRVFAALFYVIPLAIGLWWLIFFTRKGVVAQFKALVAQMRS
jgi:hypothetical protein